MVGQHPTIQDPVDGWGAAGPLVSCASLRPRSLALGIGINKHRTVTTEIGLPRSGPDIGRSFDPGILEIKVEGMEGLIAHADVTLGRTR